MTNGLPVPFLPCFVAHLFEVKLIAKGENPVRQLAVQAGALRGLAAFQIGQPGAEVAVAG